MSIMEYRNDKSIERSSLWAAYGDALGFISELADKNRLLRRTKEDHVYETLSWKYQVGGKFGVAVDVPAGTYSDDTQLRLSTCRSIRGDGTFDIEAFSKIELTVWPSYALGAGIGSKAASENLKSGDVIWLTNFFDNKRSKYIQCGGNGAAMRIQPHVWSAKKPQNIKSFLGDVLRNALSTHGHPRGFLGAAFHAMCLAYILSARDLPRPDEWGDIVSNLSLVSDVIYNDKDLAMFWVNTWEHLHKKSLKEAINTVKDEMHEDLRRIDKRITNVPKTAYEAIVHECGGLEAATRGSGTKTALFALVLGWLSRDAGAKYAVTTAANMLGSDTDTIGTMAGALIGAISDEEPTGKIQDFDYISSEAKRMKDIHFGGKTESFKYPDVLIWSPPKTQLDSVCDKGGEIFVQGLSSAHKIGKEYRGRSAGKYYWQWLKLNFGQTVFIKIRDEIADVQDKNMVTNKKYISDNRLRGDNKVVNYSMKNVVRQNGLFVNDDIYGDQKEAIKTEKTIDEMTQEAIKSNFNTALIGRHILSISKYGDGIERAIAYISIIVKAKKARDVRDNGSR